MEFLHCFRYQRREGRIPERTNGSRAIGEFRSNMVLDELLGDQSDLPVHTASGILPAVVVAIEAPDLIKRALQGRDLFLETLVRKILPGRGSASFAEYKKIIIWRWPRGAASHAHIRTLS